MPNKLRLQTNPNWGLNHVVTFPRIGTFFYLTTVNFFHPTV